MCTFGVRHVQVMLLFANSAVLYLNRFHIAVTILAMVNDAESTSNFMIFSWSESQKSLIVSSFYWGYFLAQMPSGFVVRRLHAKASLFLCTFTAGLFALSIPFCVPWGGWKAFCLLRALQGLFQACHYPAFQQHLAKWSPIAERSLLNGLSNGGYYFGMVLAMLMGGLVSASPLGWPGTFYISAAVSFAWCLFWLLFGANDYASSRYISAAERQHIEASLRRSVHFGAQQMPIPWRHIFRSAPFWASVLPRVLLQFCCATLVYYMPTYMHAILQLKIKDNAFSSTLPYLVQLLTTCVVTIFGEWLQNRKLLTLTALRKFFNSVGFWWAAAVTLWLGFLTEQDKMLCIVLFCLMAAATTLPIYGSIANVIDIAPNHVAILITITNTAVNFATMVGPLVVGFILKDVENRQQWLVVFSMFAISLCVGDLVYLVWGTAKEQSWNLADVPAEAAVDVEQNTNSVNRAAKTSEHTNPGFLKD